MCDGEGCVWGHDVLGTWKDKRLRSERDYAMGSDVSRDDAQRRLFRDDCFETADERRLFRDDCAKVNTLNKYNLPIYIYYNGTMKKLVTHIN